jgi:protein tyrosine phosphatase
VTQFQLLTWPETGPSATCQTVLGLCRAAVARSDSADIVVHCQKGNGRTGVFIAVAVLMDQLERQGKTEIDVAAVASALREQRIGLVNTQVGCCIWKHLPYLMLISLLEGVPLHLRLHRSLSEDSTAVVAQKR